ncbi:DUF3427 domain-containing protein [Bacillus timonensis]|uniref:DUF3427 domain-containing protein n=1 Tax=Bacillus timonensis TaxID=1033734 RepID=UPI002416AD03|nr:DUF3427 domain-containing protein [Bacillus timonensis]
MSDIPAFTAIIFVSQRNISNNINEITSRLRYKNKLNYFMGVIMKYKFVIGQKYSRKDVKSFIGHPEPNSVGGIWGTGYASYEGCYFIFANLGTAGRTGHNYPNNLTPDNLYWFSKGTETIHTPSMQQMMNGVNEVYIFTRDDNTNVDFVFQGLGYVKDFEDTKPAHVVWGFTTDLTNVPEKFRGERRRRFIEGARKEVTLNKYERNPSARQACLDFYGYDCVICNINFEKVYGEIGMNFIHVHHEIEISTIGEEYAVNPIEDLKPVCPNCHAMLHKRKPAYNIEELKEIIRNDSL